MPKLVAWSRPRQARLNRLADPEAERDHLADASATKRPQKQKQKQEPQERASALGDAARR